MYNSFAKAYDLLMEVDYDKFVSYYEEIFKKCELKPELILDLGCGTGEITTKMSHAGYNMIGLDISEEMLFLAKEKDEKNKILYLNQDMTEFELYGTVDVIYSALDCMNYILHKNDLKKIFALANNYLNYNGLFIFDINTPYKFKNVLNNNTFIYDEDDTYLVWQNEFNNKNKICTFYLDMFFKEKENYERAYEEHYERSYEITELKELILKSNLEIVGIYDEFSFKKYKENSNRVFFVLRRKMNVG